MATPSREDASAEVDPTIITGRNTRVRASNAMERARAAAITGALDVLTRRGVAKLSMAEVADRGGLARATLYNHVRDKQELLSLVIAHEVQELLAVVRLASSPEAALAAASDVLAEHPVLVHLRAAEPATLLDVHRVLTSQQARQTAAEVLGRPADAPVVDLVLRWLASEAVQPSEAPAAAAQARLLAGLLR